MHRPTRRSRLGLRTTMTAVIAVVLVGAVGLHAVAGARPFAREAASYPVSLVAQTLVQPTTQWPALYYRAGAQDMRTVADVDNAAAAGLTLNHQSYEGTDPVGAEMALKGVRYIDDYLWGLIHDHCAVYYSSGDVTPCPAWTAADDSAMQSSATAHMQAIANNANIVGMWVEDDYPGGDERTQINELHAIVAAANQTSVVKRPTVCAFGGQLDHRTSATNAWIRSMQYFDTALTNFTATGCDMVNLYPYNGNSGTYDAQAATDWSMADPTTPTGTGAAGPGVMAAMKADLTSHGWSQAAQPIIGMPQAFGPTTFTANSYEYPDATSEQTAVQAYCDAGAVDILAYAWNDQVSADQELWNNASMLSGFKAGASYCAAGPWATLQGVATSTPGPTAAPSAQTYRATVIADAPTSYWGLNEASGTVMSDTMGVDNGVYNGGVTLGQTTLLTSTGAGTSASFAAVSQYGKVAAGTTGPYAITHTVSLEGWGKLTALPAAGGYAGVVSRASAYSLEVLGSGALALEMTVAGVYHECDSPVSRVPVNTATSMVGTYDGTNMKVYVNGVLAATCALTGPIADANASVFVGSYDGASDPWTGRLEEVAIYPTALSATQVSAHVAAAQAAAPPTATATATSTSTPVPPTVTDTATNTPSPTNTATATPPNTPDLAATVTAQAGLIAQYQTAVAGVRAAVTPLPSP